MRIVGTNGADEILGSGLDETLIGGAGDDRLIGGNGFDTYVFNPGFGDDTISEATGTNGGAIRFGAGIAPGDVSFVRPLNTSLTSARDLEVRVGDDTILIDNFYSSDNTSSVPVGRISQVEFANGEALDLTAPIGFRFTNGADEILGSGLDETLIGGAGDDRLIGGNGFDTYVFNPGFGDDTISEATGTNGGAIRFGAGIAPGDVSFVRPLNTSLTSARDLEVRVGDDTILIDNFYSSDNTSSVPVGRISQVEFANGDVSGFDEILPLILVEDRAAAEDDSITLMSGQTVNVEALVNDTGPYPTGLSIVSISAPDHGFASLTEEGRLIYRAPTSFTGEDSFDYVINDGTTPNATGTVFVTIREGDEPLSIADAQTVAYLYEAALDRDGTIDAAGLNFWIDARADGLTERELAEFFLTSREFINNFGNPESLSDESFVRSLYENVLDRTADSEGLAFWLSISRQPNFGHEDLLLAFAASEENLLGSPEIATLTFTETEEWIIF